MEQLFDFSFFWNLFPIMFRYIDVTLGISLASLVLALLIACSGFAMDCRS